MAQDRKLGTGIYISAQEVIPAILLVLCSFLKTFAAVSLDAGASVLFLEAYSGQNIAQVFIATAVLFLALIPALSLLQERTAYGFATMAAGAGGVSLAFYLTFIFTSSPLVCAGLMVWKEGFRLAAETAFWGTAFRFGLFNGKPKTLSAVLTAQAFAILCAAGTIRFTANFSVAYLISGAAVSVCIAAVIIKTLIENGSAPVVKKFILKKERIKHSGFDTLQRNLYICFYVLSGLLVFAAGVFNYYFLNVTALHSGGRMLETATTYSSVFALASTLFFAFLLLPAKYKSSLFTLLYLIPAALSAGAAGGFTSLFGAVVAGKAVLDTVMAETRETTLQTLPLAVSTRTGFRASFLRKSVIEPLSLLLCGLFVWYAGNSLTEQTLPYLMTGLAVATLVAIFVTRRIYLRLILTVLKQYLWRGGRLLLTGKRVKRYLTDCLNDSEASKVLYALRVIEEAQSPVFADKLKQALEHKNEEVRLFALAKIEALKLTDALPETERLAQEDENQKVRQTAWRVLCRLGNSETREKAVNFINEPDVRSGILTGLLAVGHEGVFVAIEQLASLAVSANPEDRLQAATVLGDACNPAYYHPLINLLNDDDLAVCKAALIASGRILNPRLLPAVMETFRYQELREDAVAVLLQYKERAFGEIERIMLDNEYPVQFRILLAKVVGRISSPEAEKFLFKHIRIADRRIRFNLLKALVLADYKATGKEINTVRLCLYDDIESATGILAALNVIDRNKKSEYTASLDVLKEALSSEIEYIKERILLLLALLQPTVAIKDFLNNYDAAEDNRAETVKIIDRILSGELRTLCLPLFEKKTVKEQLTLLRPHFYPPVLPVEGHVKSFLDTPDGELTDWTRACAAYAAGHIKDISFINSLTVLLTDADPIIRETSVWAIGKILPREEAARLISPCLKDPSSPVSRMTRFIIDGTGKTVF